MTFAKNLIPGVDGWKGTLRKQLLIVNRLNVDGKSFFRP